MGKPINNLQGFRFGSLTVLQLGEKQRQHNGAWWLCLCDCGNQKNIPATDMVQGKINSCGCEHAERIGRASITHGKSKSRTYKLWMAMRNRCDRINQDYSCRGIVYDKRWKYFENFLEDMGEAPEDLSLDRIDVNGNYCKANCRWATKEQQANLINQICPNLTEQTVDILTSIYSQIQIEVQSGSGKISTGISTRTILGAAALICDGFSIQSALEVCVFPYFSNDGGMDSERTFARQIVQKFIPHSDLKNDNMFDETDTNTF